MLWQQMLHYCVQRRSSSTTPRTDTALPVMHPDTIIVQVGHESSLSHVSCCDGMMCLCASCRRKTGLLYQDKGLRSPPNNTRRGYSLSRGKASTVRNLGAGSNATQIARAACSKDNILDSECIDVLLLALTPSSYSSNDTRDTPGRRSCISPAQVSSMQCMTHVCCPQLPNS